ncbi:type II secretion system protein M [Burkholderia arboris]|uniref:Type II secretion system protein M n=1 Tax=Burkholderia arboris TaxID=488730 RepID=A0ABZ3DPD3_9BURK
MDARFHAARAALTQWFDGRAPRERALLASGGAVLLAALVYNVMWEPAYTGRARIAANLPALQSQVAEAGGQLAEARRLRAAAAIRPPAGAALREALAASLAQSGIAKAQVAVLGEGIQVDAKGVSFAAWMDWLDRMRRTHHVRVVSGHASADGKPGVTTVSVLLQPQTVR